MPLTIEKNSRGIFLVVDGFLFTRNHTYETAILWRCRGYKKFGCNAKIRTSNFHGSLENNVITVGIEDDHPHEPEYDPDFSNNYEINDGQLQERASSNQRINFHNYEENTENSTDISIISHDSENQEYVTCIICGLSGLGIESSKKLSSFNSTMRLNYCKTFCDLLSLPLLLFGQELKNFAFCLECHLKMKSALSLNLQILKLKEQVDLIKTQIETTMQKCQYGMSAFASDSFNPMDIQTPEFQFRDKVVKRLTENCQAGDDFIASELMTQECELPDFDLTDLTDSSMKPKTRSSLNPKNESNSMANTKVKREPPDQFNNYNEENNFPELGEDDYHFNLNDHFISVNPVNLEEPERTEKNDDPEWEPSMESDPEESRLIDELFKNRKFISKRKRKHIIKRRFNAKDEILINDALSRPTTIILKRVENLTQDEIDEIVKRPSRGFSNARNVGIRTKNLQGIGFKCNQCGRILWSKHGYKEHMDQHFNSAPHKCPFPDCGRTFSAPWRLKDHVARHKQQRNHSCVTCGKKFMTMRCMKDHSRVIHGIGIIRNESVEINPSYTERKKDSLGPFICETCGKTLNSKRSLKEHITTQHNGTARYKCDKDECGKTFYSRHLHRDHMARHRGERNYLCEYCSKAFFTARNLNEHVTNMHGENNGTLDPEKAQDPTTCEICGKVYKSKFTYKKHVRDTHEREQIHKCEHPGCDFSSVHRCKVIRHAIVHSERKSFECKEPGCGKAFKFRTGLVIHTRLHTGERPYVCKSCNKGFTDSYKLRVHEAVHSNETPFKCEKCGKAFPVWHYLYIHLRKHKKDGEIKSVEESSHSNPRKKNGRSNLNISKNKAPLERNEETSNMSENTQERSQSEDSHEQYSDLIRTHPIDSQNAPLALAVSGGQGDFHPTLESNDNRFHNMPFRQVFVPSQLIHPSSNPIDFSHYTH